MDGGALRRLPLRKSRTQQRNKKDRLIDTITGRKKHGAHRYAFYQRAFLRLVRKDAGTALLVRFLRLQGHRGAAEPEKPAVSVPLRQRPYRPLSAGYSEQGRGLRLHRRPERVLLDGRRTVRPGSHRDGQVRSQPLWRQRLPGQGSQRHVQLRQIQGYGLGNHGYPCRM